VKNKLKEQLKINKGITLIALVITIIVLLILAGVTIATLTGDNGILTKAQNAKTQNDKATVKEKVDLAIAASLDETGKISLEQLKTNLNNVDGINPIKDDLTDNSFPLEVTVDGTKVTIKKDSNGKYSTSVGESTGSSGGGQEEEQISDHSEVVVPTITATGNLANKPNIKEVRQGNIPIPQGYNYIKGDKIGGAVITDAASGEEKKGNEFVWVPVDTLSNMAVPTSGTDANRNTNYRGVLYDWETDATGNTACDWSADSTSFREPANLSSSYDSTSTNSSWTSTLYQEEYNKMIKSVSQYGGFYVGRYEMSLNSEKNAESKYGATSATAESTSAKQWYGLYNKAKTYAPENASQKVVSSMIWGSQYDAIMNWMKSNNINVTSTTPTDLSIGTTSKNTTRVTGGANNGQTVSKDKLSNIYDLLGNSIEWTQEANRTNNRVRRGGTYDFSLAPSFRFGYYPTGTNSSFGSRLTLYIK
jgi:type II secretory pathway pseudopilin PulG